MPKDTGPRPIIVRKVARRRVPHHGGAWKVAYADFVTAMMAFFLLMWLINTIDAEKRRGLADYFAPSLPLDTRSSGGNGMLSGEEIFGSRFGTGLPVARRNPTPIPGEDSTTPGAFGIGREEPPEDPGRRRGDLEDMPWTEGTRPSADREPEAPAEDPALGQTLGPVGDSALNRHFRVRTTPEGLVIDIVDLTDEPLFEAGSADPSPVLRELLAILVPILLETENRIAVVGHTDSRSYGDGTHYSNWELSTDRANAARRLGVALGLPEERIGRVSGMAATEPFDPDPTTAQNRRIAIVLLREPGR